MAQATFDAERARELYDQQLSCNAIARELGCAASTVSRWAKAAGLSFDRSKTAAAVAAHTVDLAAGRIRLAEKMLAASEDMLDVIDGPYEVYNFGGKDNTFESRVLDSAPVEVRRNVITTAGITFDKLTRIVERENGGLEQAIGVIDTLAVGFAAAADRLRAETPADEA
ncbi:helix-turn-helix domain-containing protein [Microbacterium maritypicum]|uniref:Helix-turn-helix domain-containing protein n=1 Tax=Microbacterium maritypicum TaxID=33918 RepID=A0AAD3X1L3_MICMQ|nr:helix-turn-helix domain-containing protein [Microbacterium liquefaciens]KAB1883641.1 helix-turn-helix domain-containing protein [Microbacterium liquefaciens]